MHFLSNKTGINLEYIPQEIVHEMEASSLESCEEAPLRSRCCLNAVLTSLSISNCFFNDSPLSKNSFSFVL